MTTMRAGVVAGALRDALQRRADDTHLKKVPLEWNSDDALRIIGGSLFNQHGLRTKYLDMPLSVYTTFKVDKVMVGDTVIGRPERTGYLSTPRKCVSIGLIDERHAENGKDLTVIWGNHGVNPIIEEHIQAEVRATVNASVYQ